MKLTTKILLSVVTAFTLVSCNDGVKIELEKIDVDFEVPESMTLEPGTATLDFSIRNGRAPKGDDLIILSGPRGQFYCKIISSDESKFTIGLYENFANGDHEIFVQRGLASEFIGTSNITLERYDDGVVADKANGSTIYGRVHCDGEPIPGVVVSDGKSVVQTNDKGIYQIASDKAKGYVFISLPSGYHVPLDVVVPQIWYPLSLGKNTAERVDFELSLAPRNQDNFKLLVFGDLHLADRNKDLAQFQYFLDDVDDYRKEHSGEALYGLTLGDMTWERYWKENKFSFTEYIRQMGTVAGLPVFNTVGNHDHDGYQMGDELTIQAYRKSLGPSYYSYNIGNVHLVSLDNIECQNAGNLQLDYRSGIVQEQLDWLKEDLKFADKDKPLLISMHSQLYSNPTHSSPATVTRHLANASDLEKIIKDFKNVHVFTGHSHVIYHVKNGNIFEHNAGAICATWWWSGKFNPGVSICTDGSAAGYTIVDIKGTEISYQYKAIQQNINRQFYAYDRNQMELSASKYVPYASPDNLKEWNSRTSKWMDKNSDNLVYISIWNWDPEWKVEVKEGNKTLDVTRERGFDPLHLVAHSAHRLNGSGKPNFLTNDGGVFHVVKASSATSTLTIKITDRFNNVYTEEMRRPKPFTPAEYKAY